MSRVPLLVAGTLLLSVAFLPLSAQSRPTVSSSPSSQGASTAPATSGRNGRARQQPCWQQAGVSQAVMQKRRQIEESTRAQVESVCQDSSLSQQQKQEKIRQLRQEGRKQMEALVTPQQMQAVESCRSQRREGQGRGDGGQSGQSAHGERRGGGGGPCGEIQQGRGQRSPQSSPPADSDEDQQ